MGGSFRFLQRIWNLGQDIIAVPRAEDSVDTTEIKRVMHRTIKKVSDDLAVMNFNTAIAAMMTAINDLYAAKKTITFEQAPQTWRWALEVLVQLLAPFAPHMVEELWEGLGHAESIHISEWPSHDEQFLVSDTMTIAVQVNGKVRGQVEVASNASQEEIVAAAKQEDKVAGYLVDKDIKKLIYVPKKLVSIVI